METIKQQYNTNKTIILLEHKLMNDRMLAFFQGACWALATVNPDLMQDYICMCETVDERLK